MKVRNKIGFHTGPGGNATGIGDWMKALDAAGIPFMIKSVDSYGPVFEASQRARQSGVKHTLVYRISTVGQRHEYDYDVPPYKDPRYANDPQGGAELHWEKTRAKLPPEFDKDLTWIEPINEVDRNLCDWLGHFAVHIANLAQRDGYKVSLFAWSSGEPEPAGWEEPGMLDYLRLCAKRPDQAAVALHEYSYVVDDIMDGFPYKIGRFRFLFDVCDKHGIPRPTVHITEWGWTLNNVPPPEKALPDIKKVMAVYGRYPEIKGAAVWYLGPEFGGIANKAQRLIAPVQDFTVQEEFEVEIDKAEDKPITAPKEEDALPPQPTPPPPTTVVETPAPAPAAPQGGASNSNAAFVADVTIPDDTRIAAGKQFTKTWRVRNAGTTTWGSGFTLVNIGGSRMGAAASLPLPNALPGQTVDISVRFTAPSPPNVYYGDWRLVDRQGNQFGDVVFLRIISEAAAAEPGVSNSQYVADVTIPDDTQIAPGSQFTKSWRMKNTGTRVWGAGFTLDYLAGEAMTSVRRHPLPAIAPGETGDVSIALTAPMAPGTYRGDWRMKDDQGSFFGEEVFLRIVVPEGAAPSPPPTRSVPDPVTAQRPLQTGMNINPDAPHSNPLQSGELRGIDWVRWVFKLAARHNPAERQDINAAFRQFDPLVKGYLEQGIGSLIVLNQETVWGNAPWSGNNDWGTYASQLAGVAGQIAARYKQYGDRVAYEIWNEGDLQNNPASVYVPPEQFAAVLKRVAEAIRAQSPQSPLIFGGLATGPNKGIPYLQACRQALGDAWPVDAIGIHPYGRWGTKAPFDWGQLFGTLGQAFAEYERELPEIPLWITEIGVAADNEIGPQYYADIGLYLQDVYATIAARFSNRVPVVIWFAWSDLMRNAGIVDNSGRRKSSVYAAFENIRSRKF